MLSSTRGFATDASRRTPPQPAGRFSRVRRRIARWGSSGLMGGVLLGILVTIALIGPLVTSDPMRMDVPVRLQPPSTAHVMGTDQFGRDIFSRVVHGARISLSGGVAVVLVGLGMGLTLGVVAAYRGGAFGLGVMSLIDIMLSLPGVLLAIVIAALLSPRLTTAIFAVGIVSIPYYARLVWGVTQTIRLREYVEAARAAGAADGRIIARHILPGVFPPALVQATLGVGNGILSVSALSFLGFGIQPPTASWGNMLQNAQRFFSTNQALAVLPGLLISLTVISINFVGDGLRDALDPRLKNL